jgi:hypothetical protein
LIEKREDNRVSFQISADLPERAERILNGLKQKYKHVEESEFPDKIPEQIDPLIGPITVNLSVKGEDDNKSIVKTALAFAVYNGIPALKCECAMDYLLSDAKACSGYYYKKGSDLVRERKADILHIVAISGDKKNSLLLSYVEYFSWLRVVVCLSEKYDGKDFYKSYALDPRRGGRMELDVRLSFTRDELKKILNAEWLDTSQLKEITAELQPMIYSQSVKTNLSKIIDETYEKLLAEMNVDEDDDLTVEQWHYLTSKLKESVIQFFVREISRLENIQ